MEIYYRKYDNPIWESGKPKPNEFLGEFEIIETIREDAYESLRVGKKDGKVWAIEETEVSGHNRVGMGGSKFTVTEIKSDVQVIAPPEYLVFAQPNPSAYDSPKLLDNYNEDEMFTAMQKASIGFTCQICGGSQEITHVRRTDFPVCDQCKKDLKEYVLSKRNK